MPAYDNNNSGVAFKNDAKETDKHPDWKGSMEVDGVQYWLSIWEAYKIADGAPMLRMKVTRKENRGGGGAGKAAPAARPPGGFTHGAAKPAAPAAAPAGQAAFSDLMEDESIPF